MNSLQPTLVAIAALNSAVIAGLFFVFSNFVMQALSQLPAAAGAAAMQRINDVIQNVWFLALFLGSVLLSIGLSITVWGDWNSPATLWTLVGAGLYVVGCFVVTAARNVPLNQALDARDAADPATAEFWRSYVRRWLPWNHVRLFACLGSAVAYLLAFQQVS